MIVNTGKEALATTMASTYTKVKVGNGGERQTAGKGREREGKGTRRR